MSNTLYLFIDESGEFNFSNTGSKYFVLTCLSSINPSQQREKFIDYKYNLLKQRINQEYFHATEDAQVVRDGFFKLVQSLKDNIEIDTVIAQKNKANPSLYIEEYKKKGRLIKRNIGSLFYERVCRTLLQYVFKRPTYKNIDYVVVVLGAIFPKEKQSYILQTLKKYLKSNCSKSFDIFFHQAKADINCQIADYVGWAIAIKWERNEDRSYVLIKDKIKSEYEIFKKGATIYYEYKK